MLQGRYEYYGIFSTLFKSKYPYYIEVPFTDQIENQRNCLGLIDWFRDELNLEFKTDYIYLFDEHSNYILFMFNKQEYMLAVKLKW